MTRLLGLMLTLVATYGFDEMAAIYRQEPLVVPPPFEESRKHSASSHIGGGGAHGHRHHRHRGHHPHSGGLVGLGGEGGGGGGGSGSGGAAALEDSVYLSSWEDRQQKRIKSWAHRMEEMVPQDGRRQRQGVVRGHAPATFDEFDGHTGEFIRSTGS